MGTLAYFTLGQINRTAQDVRTKLKYLRQRKFVLQTNNVKPERDPTFDPFLTQLRDLQSLLDFQIRKIREKKKLGLSEDEALSHADSIFSDTSELIDLLIWFGAEIPNAKPACIRRNV